MATTPPSKFKLSCKDFKPKSSFKLEDEFDACALSVLDTPHSKNNQLDGESDYSPIYFPSTQETSEDIDVLWDWHSPQTSQRKRKKQKRLLPVQAPKFPIKRYPSNNQTQNFERLRNELKALQEELAQPDDESCLCVSPQQELEIKDVEVDTVLEEEHEQRFDEVNDLFDDSMDEQLVLFSQKLETNLLTTDETNLCSKQKQQNFTTNVCGTTEIGNLINKYSSKNDENKNLSLDDSFDTLLSTFNPEDMMVNIDTPKHRKVPFQRTVSDNYFKSGTNVIQTVSGKLEFHRTKSFEQSGINGQGNLSQCSLEDIERKRLEALAKLQAKKKQENSLNLFNKCSPEEIENKRLQALAKLEAKRLQDIVEKKRQEALKKLQISRMKNACQVKSTLTKRL